MTITAQLHDGRTLEFPDGTDPAVVQATVKRVLGVKQDVVEPKQDKPVDYANEYDKHQKSSTAGLIRGAGSIGTTLLTPYDLLVGNTASIGNPERRAAMDNALASLGADTESSAFKTGKFAGETAGTLGMPVASASRFSYAPRVALNALSGGATAGLVNPEEAGTGAMLGGGLTALGAPVAYVGQQLYKRVIDPALNLVRGKKGTDNILRNYLTDAVGEANVPATVEAARKHATAVSDYKPRLDETMVSQRINPVTGKNELAFIPEGSPLSAVAQMEAKQPVMSAKFGKRIDEQNLSLQAAEKARDAVTDPMREASLAAANKSGVGGWRGVNTKMLIDEIDALASRPGDRASDVITKTLGSIRDKVKSLAPRGKVNAEDLYTVRKEIGNTIQQHAKESANWDKRLASKLETEVQHAIDDAIERSGGVGWKKYLAEYAQRSKAIDMTREARELAANPPQPTSLTGGRDVTKGLTPQVGQMLSRPVMMSNWTLRILGKAKEPQVDAALTKILLDPNEYVRVMESVTPKAQSQIMQLLTAARNPLIMATTSE